MKHYFDLTLTLRTFKATYGHMITFINKVLRVQDETLGVGLRAKKGRIDHNLELSPCTKVASVQVCLIMMFICALKEKDRLPNPELSKPRQSIRTRSEAM